MTTVAYGDYAPKNIHERWFCMLLLVQTMVIFSTFLAVFNSVLVDLYSESSYSRQQLIKLIKYLRWRRVLGPLRHNIMRHMQHIWEENYVHLSYEGELCQELSPSLRLHLMEHIFGPVLTQAPFLCWMNASALRELCFFAKTRFSESGDVVLGEGEVPGGASAGTPDAEEDT